MCVCAHVFLQVLHIHDICTYRHQVKSKPHKLRRVHTTYINFPRIGCSKKRPTPSTGEPSEARTMCKSCRPRRMPKAFGRSCMGGPWHPKKTINRNVFVVGKTTSPAKNLMVWEWLAFLKGTLRCFLDFFRFQPFVFKPQLSSTKKSTSFFTHLSCQRFVGKMRRHFGQSNLISFVSVLILPWSQNIS